MVAQRVSMMADKTATLRAVRKDARMAATKVATRVASMDASLAQYLAARSALKWVGLTGEHSAAC